MSYDLYIDRPKGDEATQLRLLVTKDVPLKEYLSLVHGQFDNKTKELTRGSFNRLIADELQRLQILSIEPAAMPQTDILPPGSWFLQFTFTLAKPWISKDDDPFYVAESVNPVRKDKVFKVPFMSAASWKGLLRWTLMHTRLAQKKNDLNPQQFVTERFVQTLLFGDEKGEEAGETKGFAAYLDALKPESRTAYETLLRQYYEMKPDDPLPHHSGRLHFYPTFFNLIDVEVINPHRRETKAGTHPIYLECVPAGARGTFSLLYVPMDLIGKDKDEIKKQALEDMRRVAEGLQAMFCTYGFGAKTSSGFGVARETVENGALVTNLADVAFPQATTSQVQKPEDEYLKYLDESGQVRSVFAGSGEGGMMSNREYKDKGQQAGGGSLSEFKGFRQWYTEHGERWQAALKIQRPQTTYPTLAFEQFSQLCEQTAEVAQALQAGGEQ